MIHPPNECRDMNVRNLLFCLFGAMCLFAVDGCVTFKPVSLVRYDATKDLFHVFTLFEKIQFESDDEAENLSQLWVKREQWIPIPLDCGLMDMSVVRVGADQVSYWSLGNSTRESMVVPLDMNQIQIRPGAFFSNVQSGLSYYHSYEFPATLLDDAIKALIREATPDLQTWARSELASNEPRLTWGYVRMQLSDPRHEKRARAAGHSSGSKSPFTDESLQALAEKTIGYQRVGTELVFQIPMEKTDQLECIKSFDVYRTSQRKSLESSFSYVAVIIRSTELSEAPDSLVVRIDLSNASLPSDRFDQPEGVHDILGMRRVPTDSKREYFGLDDSIKKLESLGVPVRRDLVIEAELRKWRR